MCSYLLYDIFHNFYNFKIIFMITLWSFYHVSLLFTQKISIHSVLLLVEVLPHFC